MKTQKDIDAFLEHISKRFGERPGASHSGKHRAAFTVLRPVIEATLAQGFTMMAAWDTLREGKELSMSYETFRSHCRRAGMGQVVQTAAPATHPRPEPPQRVKRRLGPALLAPRMACNGDSATAASRARRTSTDSARAVPTRSAGNRPSV